MICKSKWMFLMSLLAGCALTALPAFAQKTAPVVVLNTPSAPVPTAAQGTTTVAGTVNIGNAPSVNVANTPSVNVATLPLVNVGTLPAVTLGPSPLTNVGRLPSKQVMLTLGNPNCSTLVRENLPDGSSQCFDMANHAGEILVITDMEWEGVGGLAGTLCTAFVTPAQQPGNAFSTLGAQADSNGDFATSLHLTTGLKLTVNPNVNGPAQCLISGNYIFTAQGYLLPNQ